MAMINPERLKARMADFNMSQGRLAREVGITAPAIQQLVNGTTKRTKYLPEIATALLVNPDWLEGKTDEKGIGYVRSSSENTTNIEVEMKIDPQRLPRLVGKPFETFTVDNRLFPFDLKPDEGKKRYQSFYQHFGHEMAPTLLDGDMLLLSLTDSIDAQDALWLLNLGGFWSVRRIHVISENEVDVIADGLGNRPTRLRKADLGVKARVIWYGRSLLTER